MRPGTQHSASPRTLSLNPQTVTKLLTLLSTSTNVSVSIIALDKRSIIINIFLISQ